MRAATDIHALERELATLRARVAELEAREHRLRELIEGAPQAQIVHTERILYANEAAARLFGYGSAAELMAEPSFDVLVQPEARSRLREQRRLRLGGGAAPASFEVSALHRDGSPVALRVYAQRVDWDGTAAVHCTYTDISERLKAEEELRDSRRLLRTVFDSVPHWLIVKDLEGRYLLANRSMAEAFGHSVEAMQGHIAETVGTSQPLEIALIRETDRQVLEEGRAVDVPDYCVSRPDGTRQHRRMIKAPLRDEEGRITGLVGLSIDITAQCEAEARLRDSDARLRGLMEHLPVIVATCDRDGTITALDGGAMAVVDFTAEASVGQPIETLLKADSNAPHEVRRALAGEELHTVWHYRERTYDMRLSPLRDGEGQPAGIIVMGLDITERVKAEREREAGRLLMRNVVDTIPHMVFVKDLHSRYVLVNRAMAGLFGVPPEALVGRPPEALPMATAEERRAFVAKDEEVWAAGDRVDDPEFTATLPDGTVHVFRSVKVPLRDDRGETIGLVGVAEDITERKRHEEDLQTHRRLLQAVFDAIPTWLFVKDRDSRYVMVNDLFAREVGRTPEDFPGLAHTGAPHGTPEERARIRQDDARVIAEGTPFEAEEELTLPDGTLTHRHVRKVPLRDDKGQIVGLVGISEDVTARRAMEEQLRRMQRMEAIGTLAGGIAHDFNNLLFPIMGFTELTMRELDPESRAWHNLSIARDAALRARDIVSQILAFSRRSDTKPEVIQLQPLVREGLGFLRSTLPRSVDVRDALAPDAGPVYADPVRLHQVLINLCVNASHAMPDGGVLTVTLRDETLQDREGYAGDRLSGPAVCLAVQDTGAGMDPHTLAHIFDPFFTTKPVGKGTGLGLSTVLGIVQQHQGIVCVESEAGRGATFSVYLPRAEAPAASAPALPDTARPRGDASILFVDDESAITELATDLLEGLGYRVAGFTSSTEALAAFRANPDGFDLVVTDQTMPDLTGEKLAQAIRAERPELPILLGTGFSERVSPESAHELGVDEVFFKPITAEQLSGLVEKLLAGRPTRRYHGASAEPAPR